MDSTFRGLASVLGHTVEHHRVLPSTNDRALALARAGAAHGLAVVADQQTNGRGQRGRSWHSPEGTGLYVSFVTRPSLEPRLAPALTLIAGVAVHQALSRFSSHALGIKWPNDILVATGPHFGRKLAGILVEASASAQRIEHAVFGVGVNLSTTPLPATIAKSAISLEALSSDAAASIAQLEPPPEAQSANLDGQDARSAVLAAIAEYLDAWLSEAETHGLAGVAEAFTRAALGLDAEVTLRVDERLVQGLLRGVAADGALRLETSHGLETFHRGELLLPGAPRAADRPE